MTETTKTEAREFTEVDWYGFAGCSRWKGGAPPVCREVGDRFVIVDPNGVGVIGPAEEEEWYCKSPFPTQRLALIFLSVLTPEWTPEESMGFQSIGEPAPPFHPDSETDLSHALRGRLERGAINDRNRWEETGSGNGFVQYEPRCDRDGNRSQRCILIFDDPTLSQRGSCRGPDATHWVEVDPTDQDVIIHGGFSVSTLHKYLVTTGKGYFPRLVKQGIDEEGD